MTDRPHLRLFGGVTVTLISGSDASATDAVARALGGGGRSPSPEELDFPDADSAELGARIAEHLVECDRDGLLRSTTFVLEPDVDTMEVALVLEYALSELRPESQILVRDVIAVSSISEIHASLVAPESRTDDDFEAPGRLARCLEFASVIVLADRDEPPSLRQREVVEAVLAALSPRAQVLSLNGLRVLRDAQPVLVRGRAHLLGASLGWQQEIAEGVPARGARDLVGSYVFRDPRPFHPGRLHDAITRELVPARVGRIVRSRGFARVATRPQTVASWASAGDVFELEPTSMSSWDADSPPGQEIVYFGIGLDASAIVEVLTPCLLTNDELIAGPTVWETFADPFPPWTTTSRPR